eukprot:CAMPEP_0202693910 /NCGR_PEP_ID=MMETSP1385-20130828/7911_1 /ASSEMBLY_ACC=CAM_ASM_000861 /TAXON_ID=933848 /ORGANISM="Elphidium margaritaceum" /LENGTH=952 /DNA_ID=CAMNT_0049349665 /DNA_START=33 /DNA_END=2891 /DNA_ORIENTATION=-
MADENKTDEVASPLERPTSARSSTRKAKKTEMGNLDLVMSGCKTEKEKTLAKYLRTQFQKTNEKDGELKKLAAKLKQAELKVEKYEHTSKKARDAVYKEQKMRTSAITDQQRIKAVMAKIQKAVSARLKMLGIDFDNITNIGEALDASLKAINSLVAQLSEKDDVIAKMEAEVARLKNSLEDKRKRIESLENKVSAQKTLIVELKDKLKEKDAIIESLRKENDELKAKNKKLEDDLAALQAEFEKFKKETQEKFDQMAKTILDTQQANVEKQSEIDDLLKRISDLEQTKKEQSQTIADQTARIKELEAAVAQKDQELADKDRRIQELLDEIERLKARIAELEEIQRRNEETIAARDARIEELEGQLKERDDEIEALKAKKEEEITEKNNEIDALKAEIERLNGEVARLDALLNYPRETREVQTDISGAIDMQLNDYPRLLKEIVALKQLLEKKNKRIRDLEEENKLLMEDLQYLLKKAVAFYSDRSPHTGQVWNLAASPDRYVVATGATDMTVRLWRINPDADKSKGQKTTQVFKCARIDGKIDSLCWSNDGKLLAAGTGYRDGAEGFVCTWNMTQDSPDQYMSLNAIRSRPTLRFGRTYALSFSNDGKFLFCGDTVGSIWCINLESERIVGLLQNHNDIVYDLCLHPNGTSLYSVSLDKTIAVIVIPEECGGVKGARDSYQQHAAAASMDGGDEKQDYKTAVVKDIKRGSSKKNVKKGGGDSRKSSKKKGGAADKHLRTRSRQASTADNKPEAQRQLSSMTLKELLDQEMDDEFKSYDGIQIYKDESYNFWRIRVSKDGQSLVTATRKIQIFKITGKDSIEAGPNVSDMDNDHVKSLHLRKGYILTARMGCPRAKMFDMSGKELKVIKCKKAICQSDFLCDDSFAVVLQQELIPNEAPRQPVMKLYQYNKEKKLDVKAEPISTPNGSNKSLLTPNVADDNDKTPVSPNDDD